MTNREIAQEISSRIGNSPVPFDSVYSIALQIYNELGGEQTQFDSVYSILLEILPLVEGGGGKAIEEVDELPEDPAENKDKLFRLDNSEKGVYAAKLLSSETITTNRLPDEQQIDKAYIYADETPTYYKGADWKIICADGELSGYGWYIEDDLDLWSLWLTTKNAETLTDNDSIYLFNVEDFGGEIDFDNKVVTATNASVEDIPLDTISNINGYVIPAIYNAPESIQIGNAYVYTDDGFQCVYTGEETTIEVDGESINAYKWYNDDEWLELYSTKRASEIYYADANDESDPIISDTIFYSSDGIRSGAYNAYIPQLNAPDSEQVDNAYVSEDDGGDEVERFYYTGVRKTIVVSDGSLYAYIWGENTSTSEYYDWNYATTVPANEIYGNEKVSLVALDDYGWTVSGDTLTNLEISLNDLEENNIIPIGSDGDTISIVKYQRTETTEEWDWENIIPPYATTAEIEALFADAPVQPGPPSDEIWYTTSNGQVMSGYNTAVLPNVVSNTYSDGKGILKFAQPITSIGTDAFLRAYTIQTLNLPYTVNYLASNSVCHYEASWSTALHSDVTFNSDTPPTNNNAFGVLDEYNECTIRVPADALQTYRSAWEYYSRCIVAQN